MAYVAPYIGPQGLVVPTYADILAQMLDDYRAIYGQNVYLGVDSADYQWISVIALKQNDAMECLQLIYNGRSPATAVYADLDAIVLLNGIRRKAPSYSSAILTVVGTPNGTITNGVAQDQNGFQWILPPSVTIPSGGTVNVVATCSVSGPIRALAGTINIVSTITAAWSFVTNAADATPGTNVETDSQLRARQALSVAIPSRTMLAGTIAAIAALPGVTRYFVLENATGQVDQYGTPAHSISAVVEGDTDDDIALAIYLNRGIGAYTNGTTAVIVNDPTNPGFSMTMRFFRPTYVPVGVQLSVHPLSTGYNSAVQAAMQQAIVTYLGSLQIGEALTISALYAAALSVTPNLSIPLFSIRALTAGIIGGASGTTDIAINFNEVISGDLADVTITVV